MRSFTDTAGRLWLVRFDLAAVRRVRAAASVDLLAGDRRLVHQVLADPLRLGEVLYAACLSQADARGISRQAFERGLAGDTLPTAANALMDALAESLPEAQDLARVQTPADKTGDREPADPWRLVIRLSAAAGVDPSPFTLRELVVMSESAGHERWAHTSTTIAMLINAMPFRRGKPLDPAKLNPYANSSPAKTRRERLLVPHSVLRWLFCKPPKA